MKLFKQVIIGIIILTLALSLVGCGQAELRPFSDISELEEWIATQPTTKAIGFPIPKSQEDIEDNFAKGKLTCQKALELQKSATRDGYIISANFVRISDKLYVGITLAVLENGDVYAFSTDKNDSEPTFWFNIK